MSPSMWYNPPELEDEDEGWEGEREMVMSLLELPGAVMGVEGDWREGEGWRVRSDDEGDVEGVRRFSFADVEGFNEVLEWRWGMGYG